MKKPLFQGDSDIDQLFKIFQIMGTPDKDVWPEIVSLPHYKETFPKWQQTNLEKILVDLEPNGINLLKKLLLYDPNQRITAKQALQHVSNF